MSRARAVQISIDQELLSRIDDDPETRLHGRSAFLRSAVRHYIGAKEKAAVDEALRAAYGGRKDEELAEIEPLLDSQAWPEE